MQIVKRHKWKDGKIVASKGVYRDKGESLLAYLNNIIQANINDKMPSVPYCMDCYDSEWDYIDGKYVWTEFEDLDKKLQGLIVRHWNWFSIASYQGILHGRESLKKRLELRDQLKNGEELLRNDWGVIIGIQQCK